MWFGSAPFAFAECRQGRQKGCRGRDGEAADTFAALPSAPLGTGSAGTFAWLSIKVRADFEEEAHDPF